MSSVLLESRIELKPNFDVQEEFSNVTTGEPFTVRHKLGIKPTGISWLPYTDLRVWATEEDRRVWDAKKIQVRANVAKALITFTFFGREVIR